MTGTWAEETVPDADSLLMRVHAADIDPAGRPKAGAFKNRPQGADGMSTNWDRYTTAEETRRTGRKPAEEYAVVSLPVGPVRAVRAQTVVHRLLPENRAHTEGVGPKDPEVRLALRSLHRMVIPLNAGGAG